MFFFNENYLKGILPDLEKNDDIILFANIDEVKNFFWFVVSIKREVPIKGLGKVFYDLETPYGYGGPLTNSNCKNFLLESNLKYFNWMLSNNIIAEFTRFNPLLNNHKYLSGQIDIVKDRSTYSIDCKKFHQNDEINLKNFKSNVRNKIRIGIKNYIVSYESDIKNFEIFKLLYLNLMKFKKTSDNYFYSNFYFNNLYKFIKKNGFLINLFNKNNEAISSSLFLHCDKKAYYHLSASSHSLKKVGAINYALYLAIKKCIKKNIETLFLGGGQIHGDSLSKFKEDMSTNQYDWFIGKRIINHEIYNIIKNKFIDDKNNKYLFNSKKILFYR